MLRELIAETTKALREAATAVEPSLRVYETGSVTRVGGGIARVQGLPGLKAEELVEFAGGLCGIAIDLEPEDADF